MGQKVNPIGLRLGIIRDWDSRWYAHKGSYRGWVLEDAKVRQLLLDRFSGESGGRQSSRQGARDAGISRIEIERAPNTLRLTLHTARPGIIIGRGGRGVEDIRAEIERIVNHKVHINVMEVRQPELDANLVAANIASQIERRIAFKRAVRQAVQRSMKAGAKGIRVLCSGRLGGAEMSRSYTDRDGKIPLHTLRADIDYGLAEAKSTSGNIGIKVWVYRGEILPEAAAVDTSKREQVTPTAEKPHKGWRRVGVRKVEPQVTTEATPAEPDSVEALPEEGQQIEPTVEIEERDSNADAV